MPKIDLDISSDLNFTSLCRAVAQFLDKFKIQPASLYVCVDNIITALDIREEFKMKDFYFSVDSDLPKDAWKLTRFKDDELYELYSYGA